METITTPAGRLPLRKTADDWYVLEVRGARDVPGYVAEDIGLGMAEKDYRREVLGDWTAARGKVVYDGYGPHNKSLDPLEFDPTMPLICGWDLPGANGGTPAMVPAQLSRHGPLYVWEALMPPRDISVSLYDFADEAARYLFRKFAQPHGLHIRRDPKLVSVHWGDPAGRQRPPRTALQGNIRLEATSAFEVLRDGVRIATSYDKKGDPVWEKKEGWGWRLGCGEVSLRKRMEAVSALLDVQPWSGLPGLLLDPGAFTLIEAFEGGYAYHQRETGEYELDPEKNEYSHVADALSYLVSRVSMSRMPEEPRESFGHTARSLLMRHGRRGYA